MLRIVCTASDPSLYDGYMTWLRAIRDDIAVQFITNTSDIPRFFPTAQGILLPGGGDPDPSLYGRAEAAALCSVDHTRDAVESAVIQQAVSQRLPILGICRGLQIATVVLGGSLIPDLPTEGYHAHHRIDNTDRWHDLSVESDSMLARLSGQQHAMVNSAHHQGVNTIPTTLRVTARSSDGLPEALEWATPADNAFLLLLHWHPERLPAGHPFKDSIGKAFLDACSLTDIRG